MKKIVPMLEESAEYIRKRLGGRKAEIALVLGSGLGEFANRAESRIEIPYGDIPHFPVSTVKGHCGKLIYGMISSVPVLMMSGRFHFYEGYSMEEVSYPIRTFCMMGIRKLFLSNAAGCVNNDWKVGDLMLLKDHIKLVMDSPSREIDEEEIGPRFFDMTNTYPEKLRELAKKIAGKNGHTLREGVYMFFSGPNFETPSEINAARILGADAVGMSTVPEAIAASQMKMDVLALSLLTNMAAGIAKEPLSHREVLETGERAKDMFSSLLEGIIPVWAGL